MVEAFALGKQELTVEKLVCLGKAPSPNLHIDEERLQNQLKYR